ncbi:MAG: site-specific integrase [Pseudomonadota bacterium]
MPLRLFKRGRIWHFAGTVAGRRLRGTTHTSDKTEARKIVAREEAAAWQSHRDGPKQTELTFARAAILYRNAQKPTRFLERVEDHFRDTPVSAINGGVVRQAAIELYPGAGPATRNRQVIVPVQSIINHAAEMELCERLKVRRFKVDTKIKTPISPEWARTFADHASPHLGALCLFMLGTGARISEALRLTWDDVNLHDRTALIRQTKQRSERLAHLPGEVLQAIANIPSTRNPHSRVFRYSAQDTARKPWQAACARAGLEYLSFHCCRHGFATALLRAGRDPVTVAELGGWQDVSLVVRTYGHAMKDRTITEDIFGINLTQRRAAPDLSFGNKTIKSEN